jgi:hypothetical protein
MPGISLFLRSERGGWASEIADADRKVRCVRQPALVDKPIDERPPKSAGAFILFGCSRQDAA